MKVVIYYSESQLKHVVTFISKNDPTMKGQKDLIEEEILNHMAEVALNPDTWMVGTFQYVLHGDRFTESLDSDTNGISFQIYVNPALGKKDPLEDDTVEWEVESIES